MKIADHLFTLIKALNKTEKGYLKRHANFHVVKNERNNYIKIFNAIDAQKIYDEPKLLKKFKEERFIIQFAVAKNYLYDIILESLEAYNKTFTIELRSALSRAEILVSKGLLKQAKRVLKKAKKNAVEQEEHTYVLEIKLLEQSIDRLQHNEEELKNNVETDADEIKKTVAKIENLVQYEQLKNQMNLQYIETGSSYTSAEIENFNRIMDTILLKDIEQAMSFKAAILFNELHAMYHEYIGDFEKSYTYSLTINEMIQQNLVVQKMTSGLQLSFLYQHSMRCSNNGMQLQALEAMRLLERLPLKSEIEKNNRSFMVIHAKLKINFQMKKIKECLALIPEMKSLLSGDKQVDSLLKEEIYRQLMSLLIISQEYKEALQWLIKKNMEGHFIYNHGINYVERIIEIIIHYALENFNIVDNRLKSIHRFLSLEEKLNSWENTLLSFFRYLINDLKKKPAVVSTTTSAWEAEAVHSLEKNSLPYFVVISWLKNNVTNKKNSEAKQMRYSIAD